MEYIDVDIAPILRDNGILSFDIGAMLENSSWEQVDGYCLDSINGVHRVVTEAFKKGYHNQEPINYLYQYWVDIESDVEVIYYPFSCDGFIDNIDDSTKEDNNLINERKGREISHYFKSGDKHKQLENSVRDKIVDTINLQPISDIVIDDESLALDKFKAYQRVFTRWIIAAIETVCGKQIAKYVTIVLFRYKYDNEWHITYNAAIFSDSLHFLKTDIMRLVFGYISMGKYNGEISSLRKKNLQQSIKLSVSAIMARNMSHNLGSHVMAYLKHELKSVPAFLDKDSEVLKDLIPELLSNRKTVESIIKGENKIEMPFLLGLGRFIGYLQERQDYIATVSTDFIPYESPVNFKEVIYDELNPDLRYERHKGEGNINKPKNILLDFIAKSEGFSRENGSLRIGYQRYDEQGTPDGLTWGAKESEGKKQMALDSMRHYGLNLPGGIIGRQAVFSILENIIRNSAKHGKRGDSDGLDVTFDIIDGEKLAVQNNSTTYESRINDSQLREVFEKSSDISSLYVISVTDNQQIGDDDLKRIRVALNKDFIDNGGVVSVGDKGIKEMRISAAWLRHLSVYTETSAIDENGKQFKLGGLAPILSAERTYGGHLRYFFCVPKILEVVVIDDGHNKGSDFDRLVEHARSRDGWKVVAEDGISNNDKSAEFIVVRDAKTYERLRPGMSNRLMVWKDTSSNGECIEDDNDYLIRLFKSRANYMPGEELYVWDAKSYKSHDPKEIYCKVKVGEIESENKDVVKFAYRTHHSMGREFEKYLDNRSDYSTEICIDAITGDNSSDRLVRRERLDAKWFYSHLYALKQKVAVFDERLFNIYYGIDESSFYTGDSSISDFLERMKDKAPDDEFYKEIEKVSQYVNDKYDPRLAVKIKRVADFDEVMPLLEKYRNTTCKDVELMSLKSIYYHEKMIDFFTFLQSKESLKEFFIMGFLYCDYKSKSSTFGKVGTIRIEDDNAIHIHLIESLKNKYDYISIHQGLLDKVYKLFHVKNDDEMRENKIELTKSINGKFNVRPNAMANDCYLENFFIHSGRSKPEKNDMPQKQPFIQFSGLENAMADCKYSLIELFDHARYQQ